MHQGTTNKMMKIIKRSKLLNKIQII